ncbi:MAG: glycosyltransferase N-terminal domain-containing protein [Chitinophagales bacterium]
MFHPKAKLLIEGRSETWEKLSTINFSTPQRIWFHCASLGEFEQARPLIEALKAKQPNLFLALSFFSPSGYEVRKNYALADVVFYLPADTALNARRLLQLLKPTTVYWVKYDFWHFILSEIQLQQIPNYLVCSIFRKEQPFFATWGAFFRQQLTFFTTIFVQDEASKKLLAAIKVNALVAGDTRFDRVATIAAENKSLEDIEHFCQSKKVMIAGSTWKVDIDQLKAALPSDFFERYRLVIVPHDVNESNIAYIENQFPGQTIRYSAYSNEILSPILIVDSTGILSTIYRYGTFAYIGGGFGVCVHNILEAAVYGVPTIFGPHHTKAKEALDLIQQNGAIAVSSTNELKQAITNLQNEKECQLYSTLAKNYVERNTGATEQILKATNFGGLL